MPRKSSSERAFALARQAEDPYLYRPAITPIRRAAPSKRSVRSQNKGFDSLTVRPKIVDMKFFPLRNNPEWI